MNASSIPLDKASRERDPLPPNNSTATPPSKYGPIILNMDSFTLSDVGRVSVPCKDFNGIPFLVPATTLTCRPPLPMLTSDDINRICRFLNT